MRLPFAIVALALTLPVAAHAQYGTPPVDRILLSTASCDTLRSRLAEFARSRASKHDAAMALHYRGVSFERGSAADSAIECYRGALARRYGNPARDALVDALLRRRAPGDVDEAIRTLEQASNLEELPEGRTDVRPAGNDPVRLGWACVLAGQAKRGLELISPIESGVATTQEGRYHLAKTFIESGHAARATDYLVMLSADARLQDREIAELVASAERATGFGTRIKQRGAAAIRQKDDDERAVLKRLGGHRVSFRARDGAMVGGVLLADTTLRRAVRAAIVLPVPGDTPADFDSLLTALRGHGMAVFFLDPRGSGWSATPECALSYRWNGQEDAIETRVARDVQDAITECARLVRVDASGCLVIGVGRMFSVVLVAAREDPRVAALALIDPMDTPVLRGVNLVGVRAIQRPTYFQLPTNSSHFHASHAFFDTLYQCSPRETSRWVQVSSIARGESAFGFAPGVTAQFVRWLDEVLPRKSPRRPATRAGGS